MDGSRSYSKYLSKVDVWILSLGCIIGWGAFVMPGTTFLPLAGPAGTVIAVILSAAVMLVIAANYAYLMKKQPGIGGVYSYTKEAFGRDHAFISSWFLCLAYLSLIPQNATALAVVGRALIGNGLQRGLHYRLAGYDVYLGELAISIALLVVIAALAVYCKRFLQTIQTVFGIVLILGVFIISIAALPHVDLHTVFDSYGKASPLEGIFSIVILAPWAFVGFEVVSLETAHFKFNVQRSRLLIGIAILLGSFMYISMSVIAASVVPDGYATWQDYLADIDKFSNYAAIPTFNAAKMLIGDGGLVIMAITVLSAIITSVIGFYRASTRILTNMAEDNILTRSFAKPAFCFRFIMIVSILLSLFGRNVLAWVVDLSSFGAIIAFGYTSAAAYRNAVLEQNSKMKASGVAGIIASVVFVVAQLVPYISSIEAMNAESYLLLALWCLMGFLFYWRTMTQTKNLNFGNELTTMTALFSLLLYSSVIWYVKTVLREEGEGMRVAASRNAMILLVLVIFGLCIMMLIHTLLRRRQISIERDHIHAIEGSKAKSQFLFNMSHDIRTPMNAIIGFTHLGKQKGLTADEKDAYLDKIESSGEQLLNIINDVLDMSRIENDKLELEAEPTDIKAAFMELRDLFSTQMKEHDIDFTVDTSGVDDEWVMCDKNRLMRVLLNLLSNASKFTPDGGSVSASISEKEKKGDKASYEIRVKDSGIGMSKEFTESLFEPFERERTSTVSGIQGTGLGMSITKGIVDLMGGTIQVFTEPGKGTEFVITVDLDLASAPEDAGKAEPENAVDLSEVRLLLVEDNEINMEIATMILRQAGIEVETAVNGKIAVEMIEKSEHGYYDLVLMDIQMPVMDGYEATKAIRALEDKELASVPVIAMTANAFAEDIQTAKNAGMNEHIAKPIDINILMSTIGKVLSK